MCASEPFLKTPNYNLQTAPQTLSPNLPSFSSSKNPPQKNKLKSHLHLRIVRLEHRQILHRKIRVRKRGRIIRDIIRTCPCTSTLIKRIPSPISAKRQIKNDLMIVETFWDIGVGTRKVEIGHRPV